MIIKMLLATLASSILLFSQDVNAGSGNNFKKYIKIGFLKVKR